MEHRAAARIVLAGGCAVIVITLVVVAVVTAGQPLQISDRSMGALSAWSGYSTAIATSLLVLIAIFGGLEARTEFRTGHRPVPTLGGGRFVAEGVEVIVENVGPGTLVNLKLRLWVVFASSGPMITAQIANAIEQAARLVETMPPFFESDLGALAPGGARTELLRYGLRASLYDPAWALGWGVIMWDAEATDLFGTKHPGSGYILTEGGTLRRAV